MRTLTLPPRAILSALFLTSLSAPVAGQTPGVLGAESMGMSPRVFATHSWVDRQTVAPGDTVHARMVAINLADTTITLTADPCGMHFSGDLQVTPLGGARECTPAPVRIPPGDSLAADWAAVVTSPPGRYRVTMREEVIVGHSGAQTFELTVVEPGDSRNRVRGPGRPTPRLPFVLRFRGEEGSDVSESDVESIVEHAVGMRDYLALPLHPGVPAAVKGFAYLLVEVERRRSGEYDIGMAWMDREGRACGRSRTTAMVRTPVLFGAHLAVLIRERVVEMRRDCLAAYGTPAAGSRIASAVAGVQFVPVLVPSLPDSGARALIVRRLGPPATNLIFVTRATTAADLMGAILALAQAQVGSGSRGTGEVRIPVGASTRAWSERELAYAAERLRGLVPASQRLVQEFLHPEE